MANFCTNADGTLIDEDELMEGLSKEVIVCLEAGEMWTPEREIMGKSLS